jgi:hypothetical protein
MPLNRAAPLGLSILLKRYSQGFRLGLRCDAPLALKIRGDNPKASALGYAVTPLALKTIAECKFGLYRYQSRKSVSANNTYSTFERS